MTFVLGRRSHRRTTPRGSTRSAMSGPGDPRVHVRRPNGSYLHGFARTVDFHISADTRTITMCLPRGSTQLRLGARHGHGAVLRAAPPRRLRPARECGRVRRAGGRLGRLLRHGQVHDRRTHVCRRWASRDGRRAARRPATTTPTCRHGATGYGCARRPRSWPIGSTARSAGGRRAISGTPWRCHRARPTDSPSPHRHPPPEPRSRADGVTRLGAMEAIVVLRFPRIVGVVDPVIQLEQSAHVATSSSGSRLRRRRPVGPPFPEGVAL